MLLRDAIAVAKKEGAEMVYRTSRAWYRRGIRTQFDPEDWAAEDWDVVSRDIDEAIARDTLLRIRRALSSRNR